MYVLNIEAETKRILSAGIMPKPPENAVIVDKLPDGNIADYLYTNGGYIYDPLPIPEPPEPIPTDSERITALEDTITALIGGISDAV